MATIAAIAREAGMELDRRRVRSNILVEPEHGQAFHEDGCVGGALLFGEHERGPAVSVTLRDLRCVMINLDPETAAQDAQVMKTVTRLNGDG